MRSAAVTSLLLATAASAQWSSIVSTGATPLQLGKTILSFLSTECKTAVETALSSNSTAFQCLHLDALAPALNTSSPIIPYLDQYLSTACAAAPCNSTTLNSTIAQLYSSCSSDLAKFGVNVTAEVVYEAVSLYPVARDVACLKTTNATTLANASTPLNSSLYNTTNGTFCVTDLATDLSAYLGVNLTNSYVTTTILGGNSSAFNLIKGIPPTALCADCVVAGYEIINEALPWVGNISVSSVPLSTLANKTCAASNVTISTNGTLPPTIREGAFNTTITNSTIPKINATAIESLAGVDVASSTQASSASVTSEAASATSAAAASTSASA